ncbi:Ig-like domain-containing protein [Solirubrobacter taibaiensis]|nr:Ig-like domain-containing protein [Solirubrobacter taibaiensis]
MHPSTARWVLSVALVFLTLALAPGVAHAAAAPAGPSGIALDGRVELAWQPSAGASAYAVYRGTTAATITTRVTPVGGVLGTSFADTSALNGTTYYYAVRAIEGGFESANSLVVQSTPAARACSTGNPVVLENCLPGTTNWPARSPNVPASGGIEGFATAQSINHGESVDLKINTTSGAPFNLEIYRSGDYGGTGGRLFSIVRGLAGTAQPACSNDFATGLVECANWSASFKLTTTAAWPSGMYLLRLVRTDTNSDTHILLAVRDDSRTPKVVLGSGFSTYQAYNNYGGRSLYNFNSGGPNTISAGPRAVKVSFDRPYNQIRVRQHDWYTEIEQPLVAWLERQGHDVAYISGTDLERQQSLARRGSVYVSPAHDEYISENVRASWEQARDAGTSLLFTGANTLYWRVRYEPSVQTGAQDRVLVCYKNTESGVADPVSPTTTWRDPTGANRPENALIGSMYVGQEVNASFGLRVSAEQGQDRLFRYTGLDSLLPGTTEQIGTDLLGWEWDARVSNGVEPAGVKTLASSPASGDILQDSGRTYARGSANSNITKYKAASGALVVNYGTNQWWRGLYRSVFNEGHSLPEIEQITTNTLADMGATATTPSSGITLDSPIDPATVPGGVIATPVGTDSVTISWSPVIGATAYNVYRLRSSREGGWPLGTRANATTLTGTSLTDTGLNAGTAYYYVVTATVAGQQSGPSAESLATTPSASVPAIRINTGGPAYVAASGVTFAADANFSGGSTASTTQSISGTADQALYQNERWGNFSYAIPVANGRYDVRLHFAETYFGTAVAGGAGSRVFGFDVVDTALNPDLSGIDSFAAAGARGAHIRTVPNVQISDGTLNLRSVYGAADDPQVAAIEVIPAAPAGPPAITQRSPGDGATGASATVRPTATFSRDLDAATVTSSSFTLEPAAGGSPVAASVSYDNATRTATLRPTAPLAFSTAYRARVSTAVKSADGIALAGAVTWVFTTGAAPPPATVTAVTPANGTTGVARGTAPTATFSRDMEPTTLTTTSATLRRPDGTAVSAAVTYDAATRKVTLTPSANLAYATTYTARIGTEVFSADGVPLAAPVSWSFTTADPPPPDTQAPVVSITAPASGTLIGSTTLTATASDNVGVIGVRFKLDGANLGPEDTSAPYAYDWNSFGVANGEHTITAVARDDAGNTRESAPLVLTLENPAVDPAGLVGAWGFEEAAGTSATDSSPAKNHGTITGATRVSGRHGGGLSFVNSGDWVTIPSHASLNLGAAMTLEAWVNPTGFNYWHTVLLRERNANAMAYGLYADNDVDRASGHVSTNGSEVHTNGTSTLPVNTWSHLAVTYDGSSLKLYVNGTLSSQRAVTGTIDSSTLPLRIGGNNVWGEYFRGVLDEIRVYRRALSAAELATDMASPVQPPIPDTSPPTVSLTAPANGATLAGTTNVTANAADSRAVLSVQFKLNGANLGAPDTTAPYSVAWDTRTVANGARTLTAVATDTANNTTTSTPVNVTVDNGAPPSVALTAPSAGATLTGPASLTANATDDRGIANVQFKVDGVDVGAPDTSSPYAYTWDSSLVPNGSHSVTAVATDTDGATTTSAAVAVTTSNTVTAPSGLIAAYGFEETSGSTVTDSSASGMVGTLGTTARTTAGRFGRALLFNGLGNMVTIPDAAPLHVTTGLTLEAWVNSAEAGGWRTAVLKETGSGLSYSLYANEDSNRPSAHLTTGGTEVDARGTAAIPTGTWTHLAMTYDGSTLRMFINGNQVGTHAVTGSATVASQPLRLGGNGVWGEFFKGTIDEVRVYNRALTAPEIQGDMNRPVVE